MDMKESSPFGMINSVLSVMLTNLSLIGISTLT